MADQLSLRLEADQLPDLPDLRPMLPRPLPEPFDSDQHLFEPWWGGERALVMVGPADIAGMGEVRIIDAVGHDLTSALPELAGLAVRLAARSAILDGELVVVDASGRADARELARRLSGESGAPSAFLAFDLLHLDGRSLLSQPLIRRREALRRVLRPGDEVVAVPAIATEGIALYEAAVAQGIAGVLARQRHARTCQACEVGCGGSLRPHRVPRVRRAACVQMRARTKGRGWPSLRPSAPVLALISRLPLEDL